MEREPLNFDAAEVDFALAVSLLADVLEPVGA